MSSICVSLSSLSLPLCSPSLFSIVCHNGTANDRLPCTCVTCLLASHWLTHYVNCLCALLHCSLLMCCVMWHSLPCCPHGWLMCADVYMRIWNLILYTHVDFLISQHQGNLLYAWPTPTQPTCTWIIACLLEGLEPFHWWRTKLFLCWLIGHELMYFGILQIAQKCLGYFDFDLNLDEPDHHFPSSK